MLTPYGPGKFYHLIDSVIYDVSLDGACVDEAGEVSGPCGWNGLINSSGDTEGLLHMLDRDALECLTLADADYLRQHFACILSEDNEGFVSVDYFPTFTLARAAFDQIEREIESCPYDDEDVNDGGREEVCE